MSRPQPSTSMATKSKQGSALVIVLMVTMAVGIVAASVVSLMATQRKLAIAKELQLQANNVAESAIDYAYSFIVYDLMANGSGSTTYVPATGKKDITSLLPASVTTFLTGAVPLPSGFTGSTSQIEFSNLAVVVLPEGAKKHYFVDGSDPANADHKGKNLWVDEGAIEVIARVTAKLGNRSFTAYVRKDIADITVPGFQHAIFYEMQLQVHRGYPILGAVHTNADLIMNAHVGDTAKYNGSVTCHGHFYRGSTIDVGGSGADPYGFTPIKADNKGLDFSYTNPDTGETVSPVGTNSTTLSILSKTKPSVAYEILATNFDSRLATWKSQATSKFGGYLADINHDVPALTLPGGKGYQQDVASTSAKNEFSNLPYALIEPVLPAAHAAHKSKDIQFNNLNANAGLILRIESSKIVIPDTDAITDAAKQIKKATFLLDPTNYLRVKAYKYADTTTEPWERDPTSEVNLKPVSLPKGVIGICNNAAAPGIDTTAGKEGKFEKYAIDGSWNVTGGLHDSRLGRGVHLLTLDIAALRYVMELASTDPKLDPANAAYRADYKAFRDAFSVTGDDWKRSVIYVQFPTNVLTETSLSAVCLDAMTGLPRLGLMDAIDTYRFKYGTAELRHPNRWGADTTGLTATADNHGRVSRTDKIVPFAPELRTYPDAYSDADIIKQVYCIPALQVINAGALPQIANPDYSGYLRGFSLGTNGPLYLVGNYNADGDITTTTNLWASAPDSWSDSDSWSVTYGGTTKTVKGVPSMIMSDMLTFLSTDWFAKAGTPNRKNSFYGGSGAASSKRKVTSGPVEIDAAIATGGYPIFEFFAHTLESWEDYYNKSSYPNPIVIKGSMVAEFESEVQHIKQAYSRDKLKDIQVYWSDHGAYGIPAVRFHRRLQQGKPEENVPGAPRTPIFDQMSYRLLRPGIATDKVELTKAGF